MFDSYFEQDHPLHLFVSGVYAKRWPKYARMSIQKLMQPNSDRWYFFLTLTVRGPFHRKDFKWKDGGYEVSFWKKTEVLFAELNGRAESATGSYSVTGDSLQYI